MLCYVYGDILAAYDADRQIDVSPGPAVTSGIAYWHMNVSIWQLNEYLCEAWVLDMPFLCKFIYHGFSRSPRNVLYEEETHEDNLYTKWRIHSVKPK